LLSVFCWSAASLLFVCCCSSGCPAGGRRASPPPCASILRCASARLASSSACGDARGGGRRPRARRSHDRRGRDQRRRLDLHPLRRQPRDEQRPVAETTSHRERLTRARVGLALGIGQLRRREPPLTIPLKIEAHVRRRRRGERRHDRHVGQLGPVRGQRGHETRREGAAVEIVGARALLRDQRCQLRFHPPERQAHGLFEGRLLTAPPLRVLEASHGQGEPGHHEDERPRTESEQREDPAAAHEPSASSSSR